MLLLYEDYMKGMKFIVLFFILFSAISCRKSNNNNQLPYTIDTSVYFKINYNNKQLITYGILHNGVSESHYAIMNSFNSGGAIINDFSIYISGSALDSALKVAGYTYPPQQCDVYVDLTKTGSITGEYMLQNFVPSFINDIANRKTFRLEPSLNSFTVIKVDSNYIQGNYNGNLGGYAATGSFKLRQ